MAKEIKYGVDARKALESGLFFFCTINHFPANRITVHSIRNGLFFRSDV